MRKYQSQTATKKALNKSVDRRCSSVSIIDYALFFLARKGDALRDLVPLLQFKKREKHSWRSVAFSKVVDKKRYRKRSVS